MYVVLDRWNEKLSSGLYFLARLVQLLLFRIVGTVWGIKYSKMQFKRVVIWRSGWHCGLFNSAGLLAAIPAVVFYNKLSGDSQKIISVEEFSEEFSVIISTLI